MSRRLLLVVFTAIIALLVTPVLIGSPPPAGAEDPYQAQLRAERMRAINRVRNAPLVTEDQLWGRWRVRRVLAMSGDRREGRTRLVTDETTFFHHGVYTLFEDGSLTAGPFDVPGTWELVDDGEVLRVNTYRDGDEFYEVAVRGKMMEWVSQTPIPVSAGLGDVVVRFIWEGQPGQWETLDPSSAAPSIINPIILEGAQTEWIRRGPFPQMPQEAIDDGWDEVDCTVSMTLDDQGRPYQFGFPDCPEVMRENVQDALQQWRAVPGLENGTAVIVVVPVR